MAEKVGHGDSLDQDKFGKKNLSVEEDSVVLKKNLLAVVFELWPVLSQPLGKVLSVVRCRQEVCTKCCWFLTG